MRYKVTKESQPRSSEKPSQQFSSGVPPSRGIYGVGGERLVQVQSKDKCRALPMQFINGKKHRLECQHAQVLSSETVSLKGDEPE